MEIRVALFEDNKMIRDALQAILNGTPGLTCCGAFPDVNRWDIEIRRCQPQVILMDIEMPGLSGIDATRAICEKYPDMRILIQTVFHDHDKIFQALCAGASGYILKNDPPAKLIEAIFDVFQGGAPLSPVVAKKMLSFFAHKNVILISPGNMDFHLTERETQILQLIVQGNNPKGIAEKASISYETVRSHIKNIYKKLHVTSRSEAVIKAIQTGIA